MAPDGNGQTGRAAVTWYDMTTFVGATASRLEHVSKRLEDQLDRHERYHQDELAKRLDDAVKAPGRAVLMVCTLLAAVAAAFSIYAAVHPQHPQIVVRQSTGQTGN